MGIQVKLADSKDLQQAIYSFRYRIYIDEFQLTVPEADHRQKLLKDDLDEFSSNYALVEDGRVVGSLRLLLFEKIANLNPLIHKYDCQDVLDTFGAKVICTTSRFMLDPNLRHGRIIFKLMAAAYDEACNQGARFNYGDCSPHLLPFYEHLGYRRYTQAYNDTSYGYKLPILMIIRDLERFQQVRSPLARLTKRYPDDAELRDWFAAQFPNYLTDKSAAFLSEDQFFDLLSDRVGEDPLHRLSLFRDMERPEVDKVLKMATLIKAKPGDRIIRQGDQEKTLYVMLSGVAEVTLDQAPDKPFMVVAAGDVFGEIGLITETARTANVTTCVDSEVLVLSGDFLETMVRQEPAIAAKLLLNLSRVLAERLTIITERLPVKTSDSQNRGTG